MSDNSTTTATPHSVSDKSVAERLRYVAQVAHDLARTLHAQREMLQPRGVTIPPEPLDELSGVYEKLTRLLNTFGETLAPEAELEQLREVVRNAELINSKLELDLVLSDVVDTIIALTGAERGYIVLKNPESDQIEFRVARDKKRRDLPASEFTVSQSVIDHVAATGQLIVTNHALTDQRFGTSLSIPSLRLVSILCVPLMRKGAVTGAIYADSRLQSELFGLGVQALVQTLANQAALAIENARLFDSVRASLSEITAMRDLMSNVFESIASGVITLDSENQITTLNAAAARILGISAQSGIGHRLDELLPARSDLLVRSLARVREQHTGHDFDLDLILPSRGSVNLGLRLSLLRNSGVESDIPGIAIVLNDLTEAKRHHAQISVLTRYLPPALVDQIEVYDRAQLGGMEREISVLSCDIRGFTSFSEGLDPEQLMHIINIYLGISSDAIHLSGGVIDKFMGDAVTALFNTQINPQADHAVRAVRTAMLLARDVQARHETLPPEQHLFFGIGVHTGTAVLGNVGSETRKEFTAIGDTVQLSKLLQENAGKGEVLISQQTYEQIAPYFDCEWLEPRKRKDRRDFDGMYIVHGLKTS